MRFKSSLKSLHTINLTPMIDVVFLLLIFFMLTTQFSHPSDLTINLPQTKTKLTDNHKNEIVLFINQQGEYFINAKTKTIILPNQLNAELAKLFTQNPKSILTLAADGNTPHQAVVSAIEQAKAVGFNQLNIRTKHITNESNHNPQS